MVIYNVLFRAVRFFDKLCNIFLTQFTLLAYLFNCLLKQKHATVQ